MQGQITADDVTAVRLNCYLVDGNCMVSDKEKIQHILDEMKKIQVAEIKEDADVPMTIAGMKSSEMCIYTDRGQILIETGGKFGKQSNGISVGTDDEDKYYDPISSLDEVLEKLQKQCQKDVRELTTDEIKKLAEDDNLTWRDFENVEGSLCPGEFISDTDEGWWVRAYNDAENDAESVDKYQPDEVPDHIELYSKSGKHMDIREAGLETFITENIDTVE